MRTTFCVLAMLVGGCATTFTGSAHIEDGRAGCERKCQGDGLEMSSLVYMGEYSSACVCKVRSAAPEDGAAPGGAAAAAVGVIMNMRESERRNDDALISSSALR